MEIQIVAMGGGGFAMEPENLLLERIQDCGLPIADCGFLAA